jgi:hypothetical protein
MLRELSRAPGSHEPATIILVGAGIDDAYTHEFGFCETHPLAYFPEL